MSDRVTRRQFVRGLVVAAGSGVLAACAPKTVKETVVVEKPVKETVVVEKPVKETVVVTEEKVVTATPAPAKAAIVTIMHDRKELNEDQEAQFEADHPEIQIEFVDHDVTRFVADYAAGRPADLLRVQAPSIPQFLARGMLFNLTPYFEASDVLRPDDLAPANDYYKALGPFNIGSGLMYGMCKDWSPDFTVYAYKTAFEDAGVEVPDHTEAPTYAELLELARKVSKSEGDRTLIFGFDYELGWIGRMIGNILAETGQTLYVEDYSKLSLRDREGARSIAEYFYTLAHENLGVNEVNPSPNWIGADFTTGVVAMLQYGYWFSAMAESEITAGKVVMLPAPTWSGKRRDPTMTATGMIMAAASKVPDQAWTVFEWYNGGEPSVGRASSGWGVPALKSQYPLMPNETDFQKQVQEVLKGELELATPPIQFNPYLSEMAFGDSWSQNMLRSLQGEFGFDQFLQNVESEVNTAIQEGIDRIG